MKLITVRQASDKLGMSVPSFYRKTKSEPGFPQIVKISEGMARTVDEEVEAYAEQAVREYRANPSKRASASTAAAASVAVRAEKKKAAAHLE